ncbi:MAG: hypothetical protein HW421_3882 [Ignavibacteria bacterium]|nr:hypothetical protein [Ignavibacteria bacterium]
MKRINKLIILCMISLTGCVELPTELAVPEWNTDLNIPLTKREFSLRNVVNEDKYIQVDTTPRGLLYRIFSDTIQKKYSINNFLRNQLTGNYTNYQVPIVQGEGDAAIRLDNGAEIDSAYITTGSMSMEIFNPSNTDLDFEITLPAMRRPDGSVYVYTGTARAMNKTVINQTIDGFSYTSSAQEKKYEIVAHVKSLTNWTGDTIVFNLYIKNTNFSYIKGIIPEKEVDPLSQTLAIPLTTDSRQFRDKIHFADPVLTIIAAYLSQYTMLFDVLLRNVRITGLRTDGLTTQMKDGQGNFNLGEMLIENGYLKKEFTSKNSNISDFLAFAPDSIRIDADVYMNPSRKRGIATDKDTIQIKTYCRATSQLALDPIDFTDTLKMEISNDNRKHILDCRSAKLSFESTNALPIAADVKVTFTDSIYTSIFSKSFTINGATPQKDSIPSIPFVDYRTIPLDSTEVVQFSNAHYVIFKLKTQTTKSQYTPYISPESKIKFHSYCQIKYHVNPNK